MKKKSRNNYNRARRRNLRVGSKTVKQILLQKNSTCDICGATHELELHHICLIRHGFPTRLETCALLCHECHKKFHQQWDNYLDTVHRHDKQADFVTIYNLLKKL